MTRVLVLKSPGYAGLGDLLLALDRALLVARATDRVLVIEWRDTPYGRDGANLFDELFMLRGVELRTTSALAHPKGDATPCPPGRNVEAIRPNSHRGLSPEPPSLI